ncbi:MAG: superoxide dismutase family protein [Bacteroidota bacterium]
MKKFALLYLSIILIILSCSSDQELINDLESTAFASASLNAMSLADTQFAGTSFKNYNVDEEISYGNASFEQIGNVVRLQINVTGQEPNSSGAIHIHHGSPEKPERHWNQLSLYSFCRTRSMGTAWAKPAAGDVGNIQYDENGEGTFVIETDLWALNTGDERDIIEKVIVLHKEPQDFTEECDPNHSHLHLHNNPKIAVGRIQLTSGLPGVEQMSAIDFPDFTICK